MPTSSAHVATDAAPRYAKQLIAHLGRKVPVEELPDGGRLTFEFGTGVVRAAADGVLLEASAADEAGLARAEDVLGRHLERFGQRNELTVEWSRATD
jgi:uncharacterized protein